MSNASSAKVDGLKEEMGPKDEGELLEALGFTAVSAAASEGSEPGLEINDAATSELGADAAAAVVLRESGRWAARRARSTACASVLLAAFGLE